MGYIYIYSILEELYTPEVQIIIIIIISYFDWVDISLRLLLRPPVSHTLAHTHNQIKLNSNSLMAAVGHLLSCPRLVAGGCREKNFKWHTGGVVPSVQCLTDFSANLLSHQHPPNKNNMPAFQDTKSHVTQMHFSPQFSGDISSLVRRGLLNSLFQWLIIAGFTRRRFQLNSFS